MAVQSAQVQVKKRGELGSRANKKLRDAGFLPGVVYGHKEEVVPVTLPRKEVVNHLNKGAHVFDLHMEGKSEKVLVKEVQYDHLGTSVIHVDFARVSLDEKVKVSVTLELKGVPKGEADGGVLQQIIVALENWWDKYAVTLEALEDQAHTAREALKRFESALGYV